ncbi:hypothetical protein NR798_17020 [Archangium gephyra]|uniref:hypothetical protein n=1 Tax=Archangium gephyra TaxID=48 RepID=UPI0035D49A8F
MGFDLKELGDMGSGHYVDMLSDEKRVATVIFDSIGYYDTKPGSQTSLPGMPAPDTGDFLAIIGNDHSLDRPRRGSGSCWDCCLAARPAPRRARPPPATRNQAPTASPPLCTRDWASSSPTSAF